MFNLLSLARDKMNFSYSLVKSVDGSLGIQELNGSWSGITGMLQRQELDFSISAFSSEPNQVKHIFTEHKQSQERSVIFAAELSIQPLQSQHQFFHIGDSNSIPLKNTS